VHASQTFLWRITLVRRGAVLWTAEVGRQKQERRGIDADGECSHHGYMAQRATVGARELKTRLGAYLQQVRRGRTLVVTDRGQPVAELKPLPGRPTNEDAKLERLKALGAVTRRPLAPFRPIRARDRRLVSDAIIADREDRA